jgi:hypothetical protein
MKTVSANASALSSFFRNTSESDKRAAYSSASSKAIDSQRKVLEEAKSIKDAKKIACA